MKKIFFLLVTSWGVLWFFAACEKSDVGTLSAPSPVLFTPTIGYVEVLKIAQKGAEMLESISETRASSSRRIIDPGKVRYLVNPATCADDSPDTLMYVFNFADDAGFALVATARESDQQLAVTEQGSYMPGVPTGNPGFDMYMECAENYLQSLNANGGGIGGGGGAILPPFMCKLESFDEVDEAGPFVQVACPYTLYCYRDGQLYGIFKNGQRH